MLAVRSRTLMLIVALANVVSLAQFHVRHVLTSSIEYDDAHLANVAKNLAMGFGYSTSYHEIVPFNPQASTGPTILLPAAAFVRLFGNRYWVPTFSIVVCIWTTLLLVVRLLRRHLDPSDWCVATALIAFALMLYHVGEFGLLGDVPAALLAIASLLYLCGLRERTNRRASVFAAGLLLGLAIEAKLITALVLPTALLYLLLAPEARVSTARLGRVRSCLMFLVAAFLPFALWEAWQFVAVGFSAQAWMDLKARQYAFFSTWSGVGELQTSSLGRSMFDSAARKGPLLVEYFGRLGLILFPAALAVAIVALWLPRTGVRRFDGARGAVLVMLGAAATHFVWWLTLDREGWYRHLLPGTLYFLVLGAVAVAASLRRSPLVGAVAVVLLLLSWSPHFHNLKVVFAGPIRPEPRLLALVAARDEMVQLQRDDPNAVFVGYGWWVPRDLEYLLPTVGNFKDGLRLRPSDVAGKKIVLVRNEFFNWEHSASEQAFQAACDQHVLFRRDPFVISECPSLPVEAQ